LSEAVPSNDGPQTGLNIIIFEKFLRG
jgi:hypothetical protein